MRRIRSFDLLRILCFCMIMWYHMTVQLSIAGVRPLEAVSPLFYIGGIHMGILAVAIFFMLSGAGLAISAKKGFRLGSYCKKRFLRLLIPFYVVTLSFYVISFVTHGGSFSFLPSDVPAWRFLFTVLGMDEWLSMHGIATFSRGIGEWFLGALIVLSLLFPLFYWLMRRFPKAFLLGTAGLYALLLYFGTSLPAHTSLPLKGCEFVLGMYLGSCFARIPLRRRLPAVPLTGALLFIRWEWLARSPVYTTLLAAGCILSVSCLEPVLRRYSLKPLDRISRYSYELFLTHHIVIQFTTNRLKPWLQSGWAIAGLFLLQVLLTAASAVCVRWLSGMLTARLSGRDRA